MFVIMLFFLYLLKKNYNRHTERTSNKISKSPNKIDMVK